MTTNHDTPTPAETPQETGGRKLSRLRASLRWAELLALYWVLPYAIDFTQRWQGRLLVPGLLVGGVVLFFLLRRDPAFDRKSLWNVSSFKRELPRILLTASLAFAFILGLAWFVSEQAWAPVQSWTTPAGEAVVAPAVTPFGFLNAPTVVIVSVLVLYPLVSVYPQEIILRTYFFHRYTPLFGPGWPTIVASALTFAWVHVLFVADRSDPMAWIPVYLCVPAGLLFGYTYWKTKSTVASAAEHGLVGNLMWLSGIGWYFFAGGAVANGG